MFGDTMLANGVVFPFAPVEPRRYRLRILNACQARFLNLQLYVDNGFGQPDKTKPGPNFLVIGTEGGFLSKPVLVPSGVPFNPITLGGSLITAPAERWDIIIDFKGFEGKSLILYNDAPAPFPMGDRTDLRVALVRSRYPDDHALRCGTGISGAADLPLKITPKTLLSLNPLASASWVLYGTWSRNPQKPPRGVKVRQLTLNEDFDGFGRLVQMQGTNVEPVSGTRIIRARVL